MSAADFLRSKGWQQSVELDRYGHPVTWWRKAGREFPQHFALWLERSGAVRLLAPATAQKRGAI